MRSSAFRTPCRRSACCGGRRRGPPRPGRGCGRRPGRVGATPKGGWGGPGAGGVDESLGVPYAVPPVGVLRWQAPRPAPPWSGVRAATAFGPHCAQPATPFGQASMSEDCLYLNVFAPAGRGTGRLPVMVWIHGGALVTGESDDYDPTALVPHGVVLV